MSEYDVAAARAVCDAATPGPWYFGINNSIKPIKGGALIAATAPGHQIRDDISRRRGTYPSNDGDFIAAARTDWPEALDEIERLRDALRALANYENS